MSDAARSLLRSPVWWVALAAGALPRCLGLWNQILFGDDVHPFFAVVERGFPEVLWTYRPADHCLPLTAWLRMFMEAGVAPAEWMLRLPIAAAGIALLVLVPLWVAPRFGRRPAIVATWVLALSPPAIYYSRVMRPYAVVALAGCAAVALFLRWWRTGERRALAGYVALAALTVYLHLILAPFVLAPFLFVLWETRGGTRRMERGWGELVLAGLGFSLLVALFLVPGWESLSAVLDRKAGGTTYEPRTWGNAAMLVAGSPAVWLVALAWALVARGAVLGARAQPLVARCFAISVVAQLLAVLVAAPYGSVAPVIFLRYNIASLVVALVALGLGLAAPPGRRLARRAWDGVIVAYLLAWIATHPVADPRALSRAFGVTNELLTFPRGSQPWELGRPGPYGWLDEQGWGSVIETPVRLFPNEFVRPLRAWSQQHGRRVRVIPGDRRLRDERLGLRTVLDFEPGALLDSDARFVIVHLQHARWLEPVAGEKASRHAPRWISQLEEIGPHQARALRRAFGPPDSEGDGVEIWDLDRVRASPGRPGDGSAGSMP